MGLKTKICRELDRTEKGYVTVFDVVRECVIVSVIIVLLYIMYRGTRHLWFYMRHSELGVLSNGDFVGTASAIMLLVGFTIVSTIKQLKVMFKSMKMKANEWKKKLRWMNLYLLFALLFRVSLQIGRT